MSAREENPLDLRVQRTRRLLREAFMQLLAKKDFPSITVQDITEQALINRTTFYDHYVDKYELLEDAIRASFRQMLTDDTLLAMPFSADNLARLIVASCEFLVELRHRCLPKVQQVFLLVQTQITDVIAEVLRVWISAEPKCAPDEAAISLQAAVASWAIYGAAFHWSQDAQRDPAPKFAASALPIILTTLGYTSASIL